MLNPNPWVPAYGAFDDGVGEGGAATQMRYDPRNVIRHDEYVSLVAKSADPTVNKGKPFTSAAIETMTQPSAAKPDRTPLFALSGEFRLIASLRLPRGLSSWSSLWLTGTRYGGKWPASGEIDVFEAKGHMPRYLQMNVHSPAAGDPGKSEQHKREVNVPFDTQAAFHIYMVEKYADHVAFYVDGVPVHTVMYSELHDPSPFTDPENTWVLRASHMVGGSFLESPDGDKTYVDATAHVASYPASFDVAWVCAEQISRGAEAYRPLVLPF